MTLQDKIKELRLTNDYTQNDLADALNISRPTLSKWETGVAEPSASDLKKISNLFNVSVDDLLNDQTDNLEKTSDISKWKNSSIIKILLLGLSFALTFTSILFDISDIFNAKGNYVKVSLSTIMYTVKDVVLMTAIIIWLRNLIKKQEDLRHACLTVLLFFLCEIAFSIIGFLFLNDIEFVSLTHVIFIVFRWIVLPLVCAVSIIIYYKKANYINPSVVVLIYVTRILSGSIGWYRSIYQNRNRLLYFDYSLVNNRIRWWNTVVIFTLFLYCALVLTRERRLKNKMQKNNRGGVNKDLKKTILVIMTVLMIGGLFLGHTHAEEQIPDGTVEGFDEGTYVVRNDDGDGYWEIEITDNPVITPDYTEYWNSGNFNKTVSASYYSGGVVRITLYATFIGRIIQNGGATIYSCSNGHYTSKYYDVEGTSSCVVLRSAATSSNPSIGRYSQEATINSTGETRTFKLTLSLTYTGTATITVTC